MKKNTLIIMLVLILVFALSFLILDKTRSYIKRMDTYDSMGQIFVTVDKTIKTKPLDKDSLTKETEEQFPSITIINGQIADAWGKPMKIEIMPTNTGVQIRIVSSGSDCIFGTKDDLIQEGFFLVNNMIVTNTSTVDGDSGGTKSINRSN